MMKQLAEHARLLLLLEERMCNHGGLVEVRRLTCQEREICREWDRRGILQFQNYRTENRTIYKVWMSSDLIDYIHSLRKARITRACPKLKPFR